MKRGAVNARGCEVFTCSESEWRTIRLFASDAREVPKHKNRNSEFKFVK